MERFEYRMVETPRKSVNYKGLPKTGDRFAQTLGDGMNEMGREGWQFLGTETVVEKRRILFVARQSLEHNYMVYRRPLRSSGMTMDEPVKSRRVKPAAVPDSQELKSRINLLVQNENGDQPATNKINSPFEVIRSNLN